MESNGAVSSARHASDDEDTATLFDAPRKKSTNKERVSSVTEHHQDMSGMFDDDITQELQNSINNQIESKPARHLPNKNQEINVCAETNLSLSSACSKVEKDAKLELSECVGDVSCVFFYLTFSHLSICA